MLPSAGDIHWVVLDPILGTEQAGRRPALVLSDRSYHEKSGRAVICPITQTARDWPFEVPVPAGGKVRGFVLVDQVRTIDRNSRMHGFIEAASAKLLNDVRGRLAVLVGTPLGHVGM